MILFYYSCIDKITSNGWISLFSVCTEAYCLCNQEQDFTNTNDLKHNVPRSRYLINRKYHKNYEDSFILKISSLSGQIFKCCHY